MRKIMRGLMIVVVAGMVGLMGFGAAGVSVPEVDSALQLWPDLVISAVNTGFTSEDGVQQNYDFVELFNTTGEPLGLGGYSLVYTNGSGNKTAHDFSVGAKLNAEFLAVGYGGSPQFGRAGEDFRYRFNLSAENGMVSLVRGGLVVDEVCWGKVACADNYGRFAVGSRGRSTLRRCAVDDLAETCADGRRFEISEYYPEIDFGVLLYDAPGELPPDDEVVALSCSGLVFSEIFSYFEWDYGEQFVELYNPTDEIIAVDSCRIMYRNKFYAMAGEIRPEEYLAYRHADLKLSKNPSASNTVSLVDSDGSEVAKLTYYNGQKKMTAWAFLGVEADGTEVWKQTYALTPGEENVYQEFRSCPLGRVINPLSGNCINFFEEEPLPDCPVGKFRNPETNRCRSYEAIAKILEPCPEGYYRNLETNRCRKVVVQTTELTPCKEGYERNPETNRCRKIRQNSGVDYGVEPTSYEDKASFTAYGALAAVVIIGVLYVVVQFRQEILRFVRRRLGKRDKMKS